MPAAEHGLVLTAQGHARLVVQQAAIRQGGGSDRVELEVRQAARVGARLQASKSMKFKGTLLRRQAVCLARLNIFI